MKDGSLQGGFCQQLHSQSRTGTCVPRETLQMQQRPSGLALLISSLQNFKCSLSSECLADRDQRGPEAGENKREKCGCRGCGSFAPCLAGSRSWPKRESWKGISCIASLHLGLTRVSEESRLLKDCRWVGSPGA